MKLQIKQQGLNEIINVGLFPQAVDYTGIYPKGSRSKRAYYCPKNIKYNFLINDTGVDDALHLYLYKLSRAQRPWQFWGEIIAYKAGCIMGVEVPPAFVAVDLEKQTCGAFIEWFYCNYGDNPERYIEGSNYMARLIRGYDIKKGTQHNFATISLLSVHLQKNCIVEGALLENWAKIFLFDAFLGDTDRHQDNWGIVVKRNLRQPAGSGIFEFIIRLSPAFDNGTSLGYEIFDNELHKYNNPKKLFKYILKGKQQMKWALSNKKRLTFLEFISKFIAKFPDLKPLLMECLNFSMGELEHEIMELTKFNVSAPLTIERAQFIINLLQNRKDILFKLINEAS